MDYDQLEAILKESRQFVKPDVEKNIFSIGGRGHYENPISDILAFFLNTHEVHGFDDLILKSLNEAAGYPDNDTDIIEPLLREVCTDDGKKIDILIKGQDYVLIIENKIRHWLANPFVSYDAYLEKYYQDKTRHRILLSIRKETAPNGGWSSLTYKDLLIRIRENLGKYLLNKPYSKWIVLLREFLLNIEQEYGADPMDDKRFEFVGKNYGAIQDLKKMADEYIGELHKKALDVIRLDTDDDTSVSTHRELWGGIQIALCLYRKEWGGKTHIAFWFTPEGSPHVSFFVYDILNSDESSLREIVNNERKYNERRKKYYLEFTFKIPNLDIAFQEIKDVAKGLNTYYGNPASLTQSSE
jgi:hypothetical protein